MDSLILRPAARAKVGRETAGVYRSSRADCHRTWRGHYPDPDDNVVVGAVITRDEIEDCSV